MVKKYCFTLELPPQWYIQTHTSLDMIPAFVNYFLGDIIINELLETNAVKESRAQAQGGCDAE